MHDFQAIESLMDDYFRILHEGDIEATESMFMPECDLWCPQDDGTTAHMTLPQYLQAIASRTPPKDAGHPRYGRVLMIDMSSDKTALVKVACAVQPRYFIDYLTLVKDDGRWRIAAKVYFVERVEA